MSGVEHCENEPIVVYDVESGCLFSRCDHCDFYQRLPDRPRAMDVMRADSRHHQRIRVTP